MVYFQRGKKQTKVFLRKSHITCFAETKFSEDINIRVGYGKYTRERSKRKKMGVVVMVAWRTIFRWVYGIREGNGLGNKHETNDKERQARHHSGICSPKEKDEWMKPIIVRCWQQWLDTYYRIEICDNISLVGNFDCKEVYWEDGKQE